MKIIQILPADGWYAEFGSDKGELVEVKKVAFWALREDGTIQGIIGANGLQVAEDSEHLAYRHRDK